MKIAVCLGIKQQKENIQMLLPLEEDYPDLVFDFVHVHAPETDEELEEANRNQYRRKNVTAQYGTEKYQRTLKRIHPKMKRRLIGLGVNKHSEKRVKKVKALLREEPKWAIIKKQLDAVGVTHMATIK